MKIKIKFKIISESVLTNVIVRLALFQSFKIQWKLLNVINDNVIILLVLFIIQRPFGIITANHFKSNFGQCYKIWSCQKLSHEAINYKYYLISK